MAQEDLLIDTLCALGWSRNQVLRIIRLSKATDYYRRHPRPQVAHPTPPALRGYRHALSTAEREAVCSLLDNSRDVSVFEAHANALNNGYYLASLSTFHRIARAHNKRLGDRYPHTRKTRRGLHRPTPVLEATIPGEVLCWDITFLPGLYRGQLYALHMVIDLFSRKIIGQSVQPRQDTDVAVAMIDHLIIGSPNPVRTVHSDNGFPMTSRQMEKMLHSHGVAASFIRPGVSNDNAQMESVFHTLKSRFYYPGTFDDCDQARQWVELFVGYYNDKPHSGLAGYSPNHMWDNTWEQVYRHRQDALTEAFSSNPARFHAPPQATKPPASASLNLINTDEKKPMLTTSRRLLSA